MTKEHGLRQLEEAEIDAVVAEIEEGPSKGNMISFFLFLFFPLFLVDILHTMLFGVVFGTLELPLLSIWIVWKH